jgi:hypothetical protein
MHLAAKVITGNLNARDNLQRAIVTETLKHSVGVKIVMICDG